MTSHLCTSAIRLSQDFIDAFRFRNYFIAIFRFQSSKFQTFNVSEHIQYGKTMKRNQCNKAYCYVKSNNIQ